MIRERRAVRIDPDTGVCDEAFYFGDRDPQMFGALHLPPGELRGAVISCPSVHAELIKTYRKDVLLGRLLAEAGIAVLRFQYRGAGNSDGTADELTLDSMMADIEEARSLLVERAGLERFTYLGIRLGGYPAAAAAEAEPGAPLVLWSPISDTDGFMREVFRTHYIAALKGEEKPEPTARMIERVKIEGEIELLGYRFSRQFYESLEGRRLDVFAPKGSSVLLTPFGNQNLDDLTAAWESIGANVTVSGGSSEEAWWLAGDATQPEEGQERTDMLVSGTAEWIIEHVRS